MLWVLQRRWAKTLRLIFEWSRANKEERAGFWLQRKNLLLTTGFALVLSWATSPRYPCPGAEENRWARSPAGDNRSLQPGRARSCWHAVASPGLSFPEAQRLLPSLPTPRPPAASPSFSVSSLHQLLGEMQRYWDCWLSQGHTLPPPLLLSLLSAGWSPSHLSPQIVGTWAEQEAVQGSIHYLWEVISGYQTAAFFLRGFKALKRESKAPLPL